MPRDAEQALIDQIRPLLDDLEALIQTPDPEIARLQAELEVLATDIEALEDTLTSTEADLVAAEAEIERLRARIRELEGTPPDPDPGPDPEPARANPQATVLSSSVVRVSWTPVPGATGYLVGRDAAGGESGPWSTVDPATATSREFNFLKTATYTFTVQAQPSGPVETVQATPSGTTPTPDPDPNPNPNPSTGEIPGLPILGICVNGDTDPGTDAWLQTLRSLSKGSMWYRHGYAYSGNDPYDGTRARLAKMRQFGFKVLCRLSLGSKPSTVTAAQYATHVRRVVQAAKDAGWTPADIVFEYHNEYNGGSGTAQHYVNMAKAAYPVIKSIDPNYKVIGASENVFNSNWQSWLDEVYRLGFGQYTDGLSWHNYAPQTQHGRTNDMYAILTKYGQRNKMIWMTETGGSTRKSGGNDGGPNTPENGVSWAGQARRIVGLAQDIGANHKSITHMFIYADLDRPTLADEHERNFGIWENTSTPKPAVQAIRDLYST